MAIENTGNSDGFRHTVQMSIHYREQLHAMAVSFCDAHNVHVDSWEGQELCAVILNGWDYDDVIRRIERRKTRQTQANPTGGVA